MWVGKSKFQIKKNSKFIDIVKYFPFGFVECEKIVVLVPMKNHNEILQY